MRTLPCPSCYRPAKLVNGVSTGRFVDFYRCEDCGHVWTTNKDGTTTLLHITPLKVPQGRKRTPPASSN
jgi:hypothetical protein